MKPTIIFRAGKGIVQSEAATSAKRFGVKSRREVAVSADGAGNDVNLYKVKRGEMPNGPQAQSQLRKQPSISPSATPKSKASVSDLKALRKRHPHQ